MVFTLGILTHKKILLITYHVDHPTLENITSRNEIPSLINLIGIDTATSYSNGEKYLDLL